LALSTAGFVRAVGSGSLRGNCKSNREKAQKAQSSGAATKGGNRQNHGGRQGSGGLAAKELIDRKENELFCLGVKISSQLANDLDYCSTERQPQPKPRIDKNSKSETRNPKQIQNQGESRRGNGV
jgi:hypothetical protein